MLFEYLYLGPLSFVYLDDEAELTLSYLVFGNRPDTGTQFTHQLASGVDKNASFVVGGEILSLNRLFVEIFPLWIGILVHKLIVYGVGLGGTYLLCRRGLNCDRFVSISLAALFTISHFRLLQVTFDNGMSWALLPLAAYIVVLGTERRDYFLRVVLFAAYAAVFSVPYQGIFPLFATLVGAAIICRVWNMRLVFGFTIIFLGIGLNWAESVYGMLQVSQQAAQSASNSLSPSGTMPAIIEHIFDYAPRKLLSEKLALGLLAISIFITWRLKSSGLFSIAAAILVPPACYFSYHVFPWSVFGMEAVKRASSGYFFQAWMPLAVITTATIIGAAQWKQPVWRDWRPNFILAAVIIGIAAGHLGWFKASNLREHFNSTGQGLFRNIANLQNPSWAPNEPFRVISLADRNHVPRPNIAAAFYGMSLFDAWLNLTPQFHVDYWNAIVGEKTHPPALNAEVKAAEIPSKAMAQVSLPLLAIANVRYVISPVPVSAPGLTKVDGPENLPVPFRQINFSSFNDKLDFYGWYIGKFFVPWKVYIYEIDNALPRIYAARKIGVVPDGISTESYHHRIAAEATDGGALIDVAGAKRLGVSDGQTFNYSKEVKFNLVDDGFEIEWNRPENGIVIVNAVIQPFFRAFADKRETPFTRANGVQTAILVPPGTKNLILRYRRPTLAHKIFSE